MTNYYISKTGRDSYDGSAATPWQNIQHAIDWLRPSGTSGDVVNIAAGTYGHRGGDNARDINFSGLKGNGPESNWYVFKPQNPGDSVIINKSGQGTDSYVHYVDGILLFQWQCQGIIISSLTLKNSDNHGIMLYSGGRTGTIGISGIKIDGCTVFNCSSSSIYCYNMAEPCRVRNVTYCNNTVYNVNNGGSYNNPTTTSPQEAISFSHIEYFNIHHNRLTSYGKEGIDAKSGCRSGSIHHNRIYCYKLSGTYGWKYRDHGCIYCDGMYNMNKKIDIYNNIISGHNGTGIIVGSEEVDGGSQDVNIYNNCIALKHHPYQYMSDIDSASGITTPNDYTTSYITNINIYSNSIEAPDGYPLSINASTDYVSNVVIKNNIFVGCSYQVFWIKNITAANSSGRVEITNNCFYSYYGAGTTKIARWIGTEYTYAANPEKFGTGAILDLPDYVHSGNDLHLQVTSPCIDIGNPILITEYDLDGILRSYNGTYDIGAYEYDTSMPPVVVSSTGLITFSGSGRRIRFYNIGGSTRMSFS